MKYKTQIAGKNIYFTSFEKAQAYCSNYYKKTKVILALYEI